MTDFITMGIGPVRTGVFNGADVAITIGAAACFALLITAPLGLLLDAAGNIVLGMIFLRAPEKEGIPEFV